MEVQKIKSKVKMQTFKNLQKLSTRAKNGLIVLTLVFVGLIEFVGYKFY